MPSALSPIALYGFVSMMVDRALGRVSKTVYYSDHVCSAGQETSEVLTFGGMVKELNPIGSTISLEPFDRCYKASDGSARVAVCNLVTGETGLVEYSPEDDICISEPVSSALVDHRECTLLSPTGCGEERPCAARTMCVDDEPCRITGAGFNFEAEQCYDEECEFPTGVTEVVDGRMFGGIGGCNAAADGGNYELLECQEHGGVTTQGFAPDDATCSGRVLFELMDYSKGGVFSGSRPVEVAGFYYRLGSCTFVQATVVDNTTLSQAANATLISAPTFPPAIASMRMLSDSGAPTPSPTTTIFVTQTMAPTTRERAETVAPTEVSSWVSTIVPSAAPTAAGTDSIVEDGSDTDGASGSRSRAVVLVAAFALFVAIPFQIVGTHVL